MSEIEKYKKYLNFKANPRYLRRDFIVPLYTGTEPDILDDSNTQRESSVYKEFPNDMPIISPKRIQNQPYEQLELADGGRVSFKDGSKPARSTIYKITRNNHPEQGRYAYHGFNMKTKYFDTKKEAENFRKFRLQNKAEQQTIKLTGGFINNVRKGINEGKSQNQLADELGVNVKRISKAIQEGNIELPENIVNNLEYRSFVKKNYKDKTTETIAKELFTDKKIPLSTKKSRVHNIIGTLIADGELEPVPAGLKSEIRDRYGFGKSSKYEIDKATREKRDSFISKISGPSTEYQIQQLKRGEGPQLAHRLGLEESSKLKQQYDIGNLGIDPPKINQETAKSFENLRDKLVVEGNNIAKKIKKNPSLELRKQLLNVNEKIKQVVDASDGRIQAFVLDEQTLEPIKYLGIKPRELAYGVIDETVKDFDLKDMNKIIKDANKTGTATPENWEKIKKYQMFVANLQNEVDVAKKENVSKLTKNLKNNLTDYLNKNPEEVKAFRTAGVVCRRSAGGKVDVECLAENIIKETKKLETGTDLQKTSALNKFKNATKLGAGLAEEVIGFGKGVAGRTLTPLVALNSALEQFTSGNYREGIRKIADIADLTTLVGDPLGFEKMRTEARIEEVRNKIGKENQASFDRLLEFKDKYYQLQDVNKKLERAESATQDPNAAPESYDPDYINNLKKQQTDLNKIINSPKYQNFRRDASNVGKAIKNEIFQRNVNRPQQERYTNEIAAQEQFKSIIGDDLYNEIPEVTEPIYENLTASEKINEQPVPVISDEQRTIIEEMGARGGAAEGGRIGLAGGGPKMGRRGFLGLIAGAAAAPDLIKSLKGTGQAAKIASKIKLEPAEGMYPWFPKLVEKVKEMGKPFEEKDLIMEPSYKNDPRPFGSRQPTGEEKLTKHVDGDTTFILREYPDGRLAVDIDSPRNQESFGQPVSLYYRPKMEIQNYKGEKKIEPPEFKVLEPEPRLFANGPDDVDITFTEVPKNPKRNTVFGDIEAAERFATGNIKNRKIIPVKQSLRNEMSDDPSTFIMRQSGELGSKARPEEIIKLPEEFATGGRVGFGDGSKDPNKLIPIDPLLQDQSPTDPGRRDVLKLGIAGAGVLGLGKLGLLKLGSSIKPSIFAEAVKGTTAPSWMDSLMTKIIKEGTEIKMPKESSIIKKEVKFKNPETGDAQTATLTIDPTSDRMFIEYDSPTNVAKQPVVLELYRERKIVPNPGGKSNWFAPDKTKGYNFYATEAGPRVTDWDGNIEFDREDTYFKIIDLKSDISGLKSYATEGKGINKKVAKEKRAATADIEKNPDEYVPDWEPEIYD